jgi:flagellin
VLSILTSTASLASRRALESVQRGVERTVARLSSGMRINSARDDAAGLTIASRLEARLRASTMGIRNVNDLSSMLQIADAALGSISDNLQRIRELAVQAANGTLSLQDRRALNEEAQTLMTAARTLQTTTRFNGHPVLDGTFQFGSGSSDSGADVALELNALFFPKTTDELVRYAQLSQVTKSVRPTAALLAGDLRINGKAVPASVAGSQAGQTASSAWSIARAIDAAGISGLSAVAEATTLSGVATAIGSTNIATGSIVINGVATGGGNVVSAINAIAGQTGVTASLNGGGTATLVLTASDGRNIDVSGAGGFGLGDTSATGNVVLTGPLAEHITSDLVITGANPANAGFTSGTVVASDSGDLVPIPLDEASGYDQNPNLTTAAAASVTIDIMDRKIDRLLNLRPRIGAALNTLELRANYYATEMANTAAAQARIMDADYAVEMAELSRLQILQSASLAMVAQANVDGASLARMLLRFN